jgi:multidrug resistance efflux pump
VWIDALGLMAQCRPGFNELLPAKWNAKVLSEVSECLIEEGSEIAKPHDDAIFRTRKVAKQKTRTRLLLAAPVFIVVAILSVYLATDRYETTDDAYLQADLIPITANVSGPVVAVDIKENQFVTAGEELFRIDPALFELSVKEASAQLAEARTQTDVDLDGKGAQRPSLLRAQAILDRAELLLSYTSVRAPQDGIVTKVNQLQVGSYVSAARTVFTLVTRRLWVEANFKESQIGHMRVGQPVRFKVDAYPNLELHGRLTSFSPGAANSFAVLPAENATGNWVKVVQRVPVAVDNWPDHIPLRTGLSVEVAVDTRQVQTPVGAVQSETRLQQR